jgi:putative acetyltransferase
MESAFRNYKLVAATNLQTAEIQALVFYVLEEYGLEMGNIDFCLKDVEKHYFEKGGYFGVLLDENKKVVATAGLLNLGENSAELRKMYLLSNHRGKGLGKFMLTALIEKARDLGFKRIELETASVLIEAINLYKKFGFKGFDSNHIAKRCDQAYELVI